MNVKTVEMKHGKERMLVDIEPFHALGRFPDPLFPEAPMRRHCVYGEHADIDASAIAKIRAQQFPVQRSHMSIPPSLFDFRKPVT